MLDNEFVNYFLQSIFTDIYSHSIKIKTFMGKFSYYYNKDVIFVSTKTQTALHNYKTLKRRIVIDGFLVGLGAGFFSVLYRLMLSELDGIRKMLFSTYSTEHILFLIVAFTLFACIVGLLIRWCPLSSGSGIPQIQGELLGILKMNPISVLISKFIGGGLGNLAGLSLGREGPSIQIGGAVGKLLSKLLKRDINEERFMISAGASAGLAAAFNAPISGTIFALEEMHKNFSPLILIPCLVASVVADYVSKNVFGLQSSFYFISIPKSLPLFHYWHIVGIGVFSGLVGVLFNKVLLLGQDFHNILPIPKPFRPIIAFLVSITLGFACYDVLGGGHALVEKITDSTFTLTALITLLILKLLFTSLSYGSSTQGGIFLPVLVLGALSGVIYATFCQQINLLDSVYIHNFIVLGMAGILTAVVRSPILSIMLVTEMAGTFSHMLSFCLVAIISYLVAEFLNSKPIYESLLERLLANRMDTASEEEETDKVVTSLSITSNMSVCNKALREELFPKNVLIVSIKRGMKEFIPNGNTVILPGDILTILCYKSELAEVKQMTLTL